MAITDCDSVYGPGAGFLHAQGVGGNPYPYGECTWYVWQYYHDLQHVDLPPNLGDATDWPTSAHREQWAVDMTPAVGKAIAWSASKYPPFGHLAVITGLDGARVTVSEMNFKYFADGDATLAGKIDCRVLQSMDGVSGIITPHGVQTGAGATGGAPDPLGILAALQAAGSGVASAINQAGLYLQAEAMTAELKAGSVAQIGLGVATMAGGGALAGLTLAGDGDPGRGLARARGRVRRAPAELEPEPGPAFTRAERAWAVQREQRSTRALERPRLGLRGTASQRRQEASMDRQLAQLQARRRTARPRPMRTAI